MVKLANDFFPTLIVIVVVVLLASFIVYNSNRNQREIIETVKQAVRDREAKDAAARMEALLKSQMQEPENWNKANNLLNP
jgi:uncharacterized protein YacL